MVRGQLHKDRSQRSEIRGQEAAPRQARDRRAVNTRHYALGTEKRPGIRNMRNKVVSCILGGSIKPVIPEVAKRLSGIQRNISLLDTGSRPPQADSSGMTIVFSYRDFQKLPGRD